MVGGDKVANPVADSRANDMVYRFYLMDVSSEGLQK